MIRFVRPSIAILLWGVATSLVASEIVWPTEMDRAIALTPAEYLQATESRKVESGAFGMVRDAGHRFHEGIDIRSIRQTKSGEPVDLIFSALDGQVAYLNPKSNGAYGKYIVLVHPRAELPVYTLYAHLSSIEPSLKVGATIARGKIIGVMGRTSTGSDAIPKDRAHLHFEIGLSLADSFENWCSTRPEYGKASNLHGIWNGQNLMGVDPGPLLTHSRINLLDAIRNQPTALVVVIRTSKAPDFVSRHPALVSGDVGKAAGWYVEFTWQGLPKKWTALAANSPQLPKGRWSYTAIDYQYRNLLTLRKMITPDAKKAGETLIQNVEILLSNGR